jgi:DNA (cytosine-5)-methyltransferase 3A
MNVLSLFDGMSCAQQALQRAGIKYDKYFASEIDKHAIKVTMANYPDTVQLGSVTEVNGYELPEIGLLMGGSPCQSFSFAGKRKGMATKCEQEILSLDHYLELKAEKFEFEGQSYLFWEYMRILNEIRFKNPNIKFLLENVEMGEKWEKVLSKAIGVNGIHINSALVSAQNRKRIYWTNIGLEPGGLFGDMQSIIQQPKDKGIFLKDILESDVDEKYYLSDHNVAKLISYREREREKGNGFTSKFHDPDIKMSALKVGGGGCDDLVKIDKKGNIKDNQDKASCFTAGGNSGGNHSDMDLIVESGCLKFSRTDEAKSLRKESMKKGIDHTPFNAKEITGIDFDKMNTLTTIGSKDNLIVHNLMPRSSKTGKGGTGPLSREDGKTYCLDTGNTNAIESQTRIRRLTPTECERLQTVPNGYTNHVSDSQRYRMLGNGWTIDVIVHILNYFKK